MGGPCLHACVRFVGRSGSAAPPGAGVLCLPGDGSGGLTTTGASPTAHSLHIFAGTPFADLPASSCCRVRGACLERAPQGPNGARSGFAGMYPPPYTPFTQNALPVSVRHPICKMLCQCLCTWHRRCVAFGDAANPPSCNNRGQFILCLCQQNHLGPRGRFTWYYCPGWQDAKHIIIQ